MNFGFGSSLNRFESPLSGFKLSSKSVGSSLSGFESRLSRDLR